MSDFNKPLNEWLEEDVEVPVFEAKFDKKGNIEGIEKGTATRHIKTMYTRSDPVKMCCADRTHQWFMSDKRRHIASCRKCTKSRFLRAIYEHIDLDEHIRDRITGEIFD